MTPIYDADAGIFVSIGSFAAKYKDEEALLDANNTAVTTDNLLHCAILAIERAERAEARNKELERINRNPLEEVEILLPSLDSCYFIAILISQIFRREKDGKMGKH